MRQEVTLPPNFKSYDSRYYIIQTDLTGDDVREATLRMTKMAEEYHDRTRDFSGTISQRLPFYLFQNKADYMKAGGMPGSAGVFDGQRLMAVAGASTSRMTWHVVQHEGFHQFADSVIRGDLPIWVNEGLAEYFGEGIFTGDGFVTGVIPNSRLLRIQKIMDDPDGFMPISHMMAVTGHEWNSKLMMTNYDQAWSMVQFLAHGENGKYQAAFSGYMRDVGKGKPSAKAWQDNFGDAEGFEKSWRAYWVDLPKNSTLNLYMRASVATATSVLARATAQKQGYDSFDEFARAAKGGEIKIADSDWLPPELVKHAADQAEKYGTWSLGRELNKQRTIVADLEDGTRLTGAFVLRGGKVDKVTVDVDDLKPTLANAQELITAGKKEEARKLVQEGISKNQKSAVIDQARKFLVENK